MPQTSDVIVLGLGAMGSAAFWQLASRGHHVRGFEQFPIAHDKGSSHGESRIIRKAYFEHPNYVPLLLRSYDLWRTLERETHRSLLHINGLFIAGPPDGMAVAGARLSAKEHGVPLEDVSNSDFPGRFPGFRLMDGMECVSEPDGGVLEVEKCVAAQVEAGVRANGLLHAGEAVLRWSSDGRSVRVETDSDQYEAASLVIAGGPWSTSLFNDLSLPLQVVRKPLMWFDRVSRRVPGGALEPSFFYELPDGAFYGIPGLDGTTLKIAEHTAGEPVAEPMTVDRSLLPTDVSRLSDWIEHCLPALSAVPSRHVVCMYTLTPDQHFIIDRHPEYANVAIAAGFSGHGFKFAPVVGEALSDLATGGRTDLPIGFLNARRFGI